jgi:hypothetical protein
MHTLPADTQEISIWDLARDRNARLIPVLETPSSRRLDFAHSVKRKLRSIIFANSDPYTLH